MAQRNNRKLPLTRDMILRELGDETFNNAIKIVDEKIKNEKVAANRLALLSAKSWILRNKLYCALHDPFTTTLDEIEDESIFSDEFEDEQNGFDMLFDDTVKIQILKDITLDGNKIAKGTTVTVSRNNANKLIENKKAEIYSD